MKNYLWKQSPLSVTVNMQSIFILFIKISHAARERSCQFQEGCTSQNGNKAYELSAFIIEIAYMYTSRGDEERKWGKKKSDNERNKSKFIRSHFSWEKKNQLSSIFKSGGLKASSANTKQVTAFYKQYPVLPSKPPTHEKPFELPIHQTSVLYQTCLSGLMDSEGYLEDFLSNQFPLCYLGCSVSTSYQKENN